MAGIVIPIILTIIAIAIIYMFFKSSTEFTKVTIENNTINAELADTIPKRIKGLMFRESLPKNNGMLFIFDKESYHGIWMMNMRFPIDIIWIDSNHKIVDIVKDAQPCKIICPSHKPKEKAMYVLEVNAGFADKHKIKIGNIVKF